MIIRTPEQIALADSSQLLRETIHLYADVIDSAADARVRSLFERLMEDHRQVGIRVDEALQALDDLPLAADPEWEGLRKIATRAKELLASDGDAVLLDGRIADEQKLLEHLSSSLELELQSETRECLVQAQSVATRALAALAEERDCRGR